MSRPTKSISLVLLALSLGACAGDSNPSGLAEGPIVVDVADPDQVVESHLRALVEQDLDAYKALLEERAFHFYILDSDTDDLCWVTRGYWEYDAEIELIDNMFDDTFEGDVPAVEMIEASHTIVRSEHIGSNSHRVVADVVIRVLVGPDEGWVASTRLDLFLSQDSLGFYRIRAIKEVLPSGFTAPSVAPRSWGQIKGLFRPPLSGSERVVESYFWAITARDFEAYEALLELPGNGVDGFRWYFPLLDAWYFPWAEGEYWSLFDELEIMRNICDPSFRGSPPPVTSARATYRILGEEVLEGDIREVSCAATIMLLVGPDNGWVADTRLDLLLVPTSSPENVGGFQIRSIRERMLFHGSPSTAEDSSWSEIKGQYR